MVDMCKVGNSDLSPRDVAIIREVYDSEASEDLFRMELERALQVGCRTIIIEPAALANETTSWLRRGSIIKKTSIVTGVTTFIIGFSFHNIPLLTFPFGMTSSFCYFLYKLCWRDDPCNMYKVETRRSGGVSSTSSTTGTPAILVRKETQKSDVFISTVAMCALGFALRRVFPGR